MSSSAPTSARRRSLLQQPRRPATCAPTAKDKVKALGDRIAGKVRINSAGCLDRCAQGPVMVVYPEAVWYTYVDQEDIDEIVESAPRPGQGGRAPEDRLMSKHERVLLDGPAGKIEVFVEAARSPHRHRPDRPSASAVRRHRRQQGGDHAGARLPRARLHHAAAELPRRRRLIGARTTTASPRPTMLAARARLCPRDRFGAPLPLLPRRLFLRRLRRHHALAKRLAEAGDPARWLVLVGTAAGFVEGMRRYETEAVPADTLVIHGAEDETVRLANVLAWAEPLDLPVRGARRRPLLPPPPAPHPPTSSSAPGPARNGAATLSVVSGLRKSYGGRAVLAGLDFRPAPAANATACSAPTAPARPPRCAAASASPRPTRARSAWPANRCRRGRARRACASAWCRRSTTSTPTSPPPRTCSCTAATSASPTRRSGR
jgi:(2Fe-2S) ferredoxin